MIGEPEEQTFQCMMCYNYVFHNRIKKCPECHQIYCLKCAEKAEGFCTVCTEARQRDRPLEFLDKPPETETYDKEEIKDDVHRLK